MGFLKFNFSFNRLKLVTINTKKMKIGTLSPIPFISWALSIPILGLRWVN
jgi:hypothetical protein